MNYKLKTNSRIIAIKVLYKYDITKSLDLDETLEMVFSSDDSYLKISENQNNIDYDKEFLESLVNGVIEKLSYLDYIISLVTESYTIDALSYVDRNIIRCGAYEMIYMKTPKEVVINEMVNVAKAYSEIDSEKSSAKFDNAILDKIAKNSFRAE